MQSNGGWRRPLGCFSHVSHVISPPINSKGHTIAWPMIIIFAQHHSRCAALRSAGDLLILALLLAFVFIAEVVAVDWHEAFGWEN